MRIAVRRSRRERRKSAPNPKRSPIGEAQVRGASAGSTRDQELMLQKKTLGHERFGSVRLEEFAQASHDMKDD